MAEDQWDREGAARDGPRAVGEIARTARRTTPATPYTFCHSAGVATGDHLPCAWCVWRHW